MKKKKLFIPLIVVLILIIAAIPISIISFGSPAEKIPKYEAPKYETEKSSVPIEYSTENASLSLDLLEGWEYKINEPEGEYEDFSIDIWPAGRAEGKLTLQYCPNFGVCGTGLTTKQIILGAYEAYEGTYDNDKVWSFISLTNMDFSILNSGDEVWWSEYGDEAMYMLQTISVGKVVCNDYDKAR